MKSKYTELEHLQLVAQRIADSGKDITAQYGDWVNITFACASLGEQARNAYHTICSLYQDYKREECDQKFDNCLRSGNGSVTLGTLMKLASDAGVDTTLPRGRRQKTERQKQEEQKNYMARMRELLQQQAKWRFNTWRQQPEFKEHGGAWKPVEDRDLDTYYCWLSEQG
ncbi:MAG: PriCT-2 domain-containing protein, partial [Prevotella sp.]|nr:PriCT-2 domain-containing protein [Prevotella sp.]